VIVHREVENPVENVPKIYSVSARDALAAPRDGDGRRYAASGVDELHSDVTQFLIKHKQTDFLLRMSGGIADALSEAREDLDRLRALQQPLMAVLPLLKLVNLLGGTLGISKLPLLRRFVFA
jgi:hypothetical protein